MSFLAPYFLIGFLALSVPIIIHLWSKNTKKSIAFGSVRFLKETETRTMRSIMPSQWLLLISRLFLLSLLVLLLAGLQMEKPMRPYDDLYLIDSKYEGTEWLTQFIDTLPESSKALWLSEDFPEARAMNPAQSNNFWELLENPPQISAVNTTVISPLLLKDFYGRRREFPIEYHWISPPVTPQSTRLISYKKEGQGYGVNANFDEWTTTHELNAMTDVDPLQVTYHLAASADYYHYREMFEAALSTLQSLSPLELSSVENANDADWILWLSPELAPRPDHIVTIDTLMIERWNEHVPGVVNISKDWTREDAINANLPERLLNLFSNELVEDSEWDMRTIDPVFFTYNKGFDNSTETNQQSAVGTLWILLVVALIVERWLSFKSIAK